MTQRLLDPQPTPWPSDGTCTCEDRPGYPWKERSDWEEMRSWKSTRPSLCGPSRSSCTSRIKETMVTAPLSLSLPPVVV